MSNILKIEELLYNQDFDEMISFYSDDKLQDNLMDIVINDNKFNQICSKNDLELNEQLLNENYIISQLEMQEELNNEINDTELKIENSEEIQLKIENIYETFEENIIDSESVIYEHKNEDEELKFEKRGKY